MKQFITNHKKGCIITGVILAAILIAAIVLVIIRVTTQAWPWEERKDEEEDTLQQVSYEYYAIRNFQGLAVTFTAANSWENGGKQCEQFNVTIENHKANEVTSWKAIIPAEGTVGKDNAWNCNLDITGATGNAANLTLSNVDYNGTITTDNTASDVGMILTADSKTDLDSLVGTYLIDKDTGIGKKLTEEELKAFREGPIDAQKAAEEQAKKAAEEAKKAEEAAKAKQNPANISAPEGTPLAAHGKLAVNGVDLVDANGNKFQLKGVSTHGLQWFPEYVNEGAFRTLRDDWGANVVRLAMYTDENGYCSGGDKAKLEQTIDTGVQAATNLGMYVIIDWHILHDNDPTIHQSEAVDFFSRMSAKYAGNGNVIYEICNEPNGGTTWSTIHNYAEAVIPAIRANDANGIIIVGTPTWSQDVDQVAANPLNYGNVMYALHFYAGTHKDNIRSKLNTARAAGTPVFISEFSICDASGNGGIDYNSADTWKALINDTNVSYCGWSLSNKSETSALIQSSCKSIDSFTEADLSDTGKWLRNFIRGE